MGEKGSVREMLEAGRIVAHHIVRSWEIPRLVTVAVFSLVQGGSDAELRGRTVISGGALVNTRLGRDVVSEVSNGGVGGVMGGGHEAGLGDESTMLQIAVGDGATGVGGTDDLLLDVLRKGASPDEGLVCVVEVYATYTSLCRIGSAEEGRGLRHDLSQVCGPRA
jgi:hypothetical protein